METIFLWTARFEGVSFLVLLLIAMPLKYMYGMPEAVRMVGMAHGMLFLAYIALLFPMKEHKGWNLTVFLLGFAASVIPAGTFAFEYKYCGIKSE